MFREMFLLAPRGLHFLRAKTIAVYSAIKAEADPRELVVIAERVKKKLAFPRVHGSALEFVLASPSELSAEGPFGIPEPPLSMKAIDLGAIDLFIVPGVCFTREGDRIGYGKGYYDAALAAARVENRNVATIGFAFEVQLFDAVPTEAHDVRLDGVATEFALTTSRSELL
jgi:5-formyltetrahydrofolate cyclo-ligase